MLDYLFVYGTLRKAQDGSLHPYLRAKAEFVGPAHIAGKLYRVEHYPAWVPAPPYAGNKVYGEIFRLHQPQAALALLDEYEECGPAFTKPWEYRRIVRKLTLPDGSRLSAWLYQYNRPVAQLQRISGGDYARFLPASHN